MMLVAFLSVPGPEVPALFQPLDERWMLGTDPIPSVLLEAGQYRGIPPKALCCRALRPRDFRARSACAITPRFAGIGLGSNQMTA